MAIGVAVLSWWSFFKGKNLAPGVRVLYLGLALAWSGDGLNKVWFGIRRLSGFPAWMLDTPPVLLISILTITGAAIHIYTLTRHRFGAWGWIGFGLLTLAASISFTVP